KNLKLFTTQGRSKEVKPRSAAAKISKRRYTFINSANYAVTRRAYRRAFGVALFLLILVFACAIEIGSAQTPPQVRINEVESNGGVPGDWVELHNPDIVAVNISGYDILPPKAFPTASPAPNGAGMEHQRCHGYLELDRQSGRVGN